MPGVKAVTIQLNAFAIQVTLEIHSMHALLVSNLFFFLFGYFVDILALLTSSWFTIGTWCSCWL